MLTSVSFPAFEIFYIRIIFRMSYYLRSFYLLDISGKMFPYEVRASRRSNFRIKTWKICIIFKIYSSNVINKFHPTKIVMTFPFQSFIFCLKSTFITLILNKLNLTPSAISSVSHIFSFIWTYSYKLSVSGDFGLCRKENRTIQEKGWKFMRYFKS